LAVVDNAERTRLVVNLSQASGYSTRVEGNTLVLKVGGAKVSAAKVVATPTSVNTAMPVAGNKNIAYEVTDVDFRRGGAGEGNVLIALNNPNAPVDVQQQGTKNHCAFFGYEVA